MFKETVSNLGLSLYDPARVFRSENYSRSSLSVILLVFFLFSIVTGLVSFRITNYEGVKDFQVELGVREALKMMPGTSPEKEDEIREQIRKQMYNPFTKITSLVSTVVGVVISLVSALLLFWLYMLAAVRFAGGEEDPVTLVKRKGEKVKKHRNSFLLSAYRYTPLVLSAFISMILLLTKSRESFYNIASLEELTRKMTVNLSLYALLFEGDIPIFYETVLNIVTNPFWWWSGWISVIGVRDVWRLTVRKGVVLFLIWVVLVIIFQWALYVFALNFAP